jgi:hypothetical protein
VAQGIDLRFDQFARYVRVWRDLNEPDRAEEAAVSRYQRRRLHASSTFDDLGVVDAVFDPVSFAIWHGELTRLEKQMFDDDWAATRARLGHEPTIFDLPRLPAQRRLDAQVEMARRSATMPPASKRPRVLVTVLVDYPTIQGRVLQLANGTVLTPGELLPLLTEADVERAVFDPQGRVIDLGRRSRLFVGATRRAVELRDQECTEDACDQRADRCDVDHYPTPWAEGGETNQNNGRLRCPTHHPGRRRPRGPSPPSAADDGTYDEDDDDHEAD